jgi:protein gp37
MANNSTIEWTESTWNPVTGCTKISPGCKFCYAERMSKRLKAMGSLNYQNGFKLTIHNHVLNLPLLWKSPRTIFVNSMSDLFHKDIPEEFIKRVFDVMNNASWHTFQILTKRADRLEELASKLTWSKNIWMGVSVESQDYTFRINHLRKVPAAVRFLSIEPLIAPINKLNLRGIDWIIVGGESGPKSRPLDPDWVRIIRDICLDKKVPFFFKQWGGTNKKKAGHILDRKIWHQMPSPKQRKVTSRILSKVS